MPLRLCNDSKQGPISGVPVTCVRVLWPRENAQHCQSAVTLGWVMLTTSRRGMYDQPTGD